MIITSVRAEVLNATAWNVVTVLARKTTDILVDRAITPIQGNHYVAYRFIQNFTGAELFYSIGMDTDADAGQTNYHGSLADRQQLAVPSTARVSVWSLAGGKVAGLELFKPGM